MKDQNLAERILIGDRSVRGEVILDHIPNVCGMARSLARRTHKDQDDLKSEGFVALVNAVDAAFTEFICGNLTAFLMARVYRHLRNFIREDFLIPIKRETFRKVQVSGQTDRYSGIINLWQIKDGIIYDHHSVEEDLEMEELLAKLGLSQREKDVLALRMASYTLNEISDQIHISRATVSRMLENIGNRYRRLANA